MPEPASEAALEMTLRPLVERFVREDRRPRALSLMEKHSWRELLPLLDTSRGRTYTQQDLQPWHAVRGVYHGGRAEALDVQVQITRRA